MRLFTFDGGVHPPEFKELTAHSNIIDTPLPERVILPISQHTGKPAKPIVNIKDIVKKGQVVAEPDGFFSLPVHSSISGEVVDIKPYPHPTLGSDVTSIVVKSDGKDEWIDGIKGEPEYFRMAPGELTKIIQNAGIAGMGGAAFPTHIKLSPPKNAEIDTAVLNGCECEPYLTCDHRLMLESWWEIVDGLKIIMHILDCDRAIIALEENKTDAYMALEKKVFHEPNIELALLKVKYPQGAEKQLIKAILDREIPKGGLPLNVGVVVQNVATALAIRNAVIRGIPLIERIVTITGDGIVNPANLRVRLGTSFSMLIEECGGLKEGGGTMKLICGGPMMGVSQHTTELPVIKGTSGIVILTGEEGIEESPCIRCGRCVDICPMNLIPTELCKFSKGEKWDKAEKYSILDCIECGCCAYVCPAKIPLIQYIKWGKHEIQKRKE